MSKQNKAALILGASSGVGRALAERLAQEGFSLVLSARSERDLDVLCSHLKIRFQCHCFVIRVDLENPLFDPVSYFKSCKNLLPEISYFFICAGLAHPQDDKAASLEILNQLVHVNFLNLIRFLSIIAQELQHKEEGNIVVFSSIAASVPRKKNIAYTAAKAALESYCRSLQHAFADGPVQIQIYALGYIDTAMNEGKTLLFPAISPERVAKHVASRLGQNIRFQYYPRFWALIVFILRHTPWAIYRRLSF